MGGGKRMSSSIVPLNPSYDLLHLICKGTRPVVAQHAHTPTNAVQPLSAPSPKSTLGPVLCQHISSMLFRHLQKVHPSTLLPEESGSQQEEQAHTFASGRSKGKAGGPFKEGSLHSGWDIKAGYSPRDHFHQGFQQCHPEGL